MHVCHCFKTFDLSSGGVEQVIIELSEALIEAGHRVSVLASAVPHRQKHETINGIEVYRTVPLFEIFKVPVMPAYYSCLASISPDIVHAHGTIPGVSDIAIYYASKNNKRSALYYHFDGNATSIIGSIFASIYNSTINPFTVRNADKVTATSRSYAETSPVLRNYLDKVEIIPNSVNLDFFNPNVEMAGIHEKYHLPEGNTVFYAGRFVKYKGVEYAIRAMQHLPNVTLIIAGSGQLDHHLKNLVQKLRLRNVIFIGRVPHDDLPPLYRLSDVYVIPAITRGENFGISALEAMACGTPVVGSDLPGVKELIGDDCGFKVRPGDSRGIARSIEKILADPAMKSDMGVAARLNAEKYDRKKISARVLQIYGELLEKSQSGS